MKLSAPQRNALIWLAGEEPYWYDVAHLNTLRSLERLGLVAWVRWIEGRQEIGPRPYWVKPVGSYLDHYGPVLTAQGERVAAESGGA